MITSFKKLIWSLLSEQAVDVLRTCCPKVYQTQSSCWFFVYKLTQFNLPNHRPVPIKAEESLGTGRASGMGREPPNICLNYPFTFQVMQRLPKDQYFISNNFLKFIYFKYFTIYTS